MTAKIVLDRISAITPHVCYKTSLAGNENAYIFNVKKQAKFAMTISGVFFIFLTVFKIFYFT